MSTSPVTAHTDQATEAPETHRLRRDILDPLKMRLFMLAKLPLALFAGLRVAELDDRHSVVTIPYGWRSTNPFRSTYFAALAMAAEMSAGALAMVAVRAAPSPVSMLIVHMEADFVKKAASVTRFRCEDGASLSEAVAETLRTGEGVTRVVTSVGTNSEGQEVARFKFTWSFKKKSRA